MFKGNSLVWEVVRYITKKKPKTQPLRNTWSLWGDFMGMLDLLGLQDKSPSLEVYQEPYLSLSSLITGATKWRLKSLVQFFPYINFCAQTLFWNKLCSAQRSWNMVSSKLLSFQHAAEKPQSCSQLQAMVSITGPGISACHAPSQRCLMTAAGILIIPHMWCITPSTGTLVPTSTAEVHIQCSPWDYLQ